MKTPMAGQPIGLRRRWASNLELWRRYRASGGRNAASDVSQHRTLCDVAAAQGVAAGARMLEVGCGQLATQTALFAADGAVVTGIDIERPTWRMGVRDFVSIGCANGWERALKSAIRHVVFDAAYLQRLQALYGRKIPYDNLDVRVMSATKLEFADSTFDFVFSLAVFEHIDGVPEAVREIGRVLKPAGVSCVVVDLFPSLAGGHHPDWAHPDTQPSARIPPWEHLLSNRYAVNTYMNRLTLREYRALFRTYLTVVDEKVHEEGAGLLTPERWSVLKAKGYTREDLLTRYVTFICRKT